MTSIKPLSISNKLHGNPTKPLRWTHTIKTGTGENLDVACTRSTRAMIALMDMAAVQGGAACHFGGPSAFAEIMSAIHGFMFWKAEKSKKQWHEMFHFINDAGHCENGLYALKANYNIAGVSLESLQHFRSIESVLTGHGEAHLFPEGVYISNGPLGSGLPQAQGLAMAESMSSSPRVTVTAISDGGCMEGEAREALAAIPGLARLGKVAPFICVLSDNNTKLSGRIDEDSFSMSLTFNSLEAQGWKVIKVEDGHKTQGCFDAFQEAYQAVTNEPTRPVFIWYKTIKGKGVKKTEESASGGHGFPCKKADELPAFLAEIYGDAEIPAEFTAWTKRLMEAEKTPAAAGSSSSVAVKKEKIQDGVSRAFIDAVEKRQRPVISISADLQGSTGVEAFRKKFPANTFEVGVAESNMVSVGIGLSKQGYIPVVDTFAQFGVTKGALPFIMSGLSEGPMIGVFSHTGFQDAADGASHQALSYAAMLGSIPNVDTYALTCSAEAYELVTQAVEEFVKARAAGKVPRSSIFFLGRETFPPTFNDSVKFKIGQAQVLSDRLNDGDKKVVIAASGSLVSYALKAQDELKAKGVGSVVINPSILNKPDVETFGKYLKQADGKLLTLEDHREVGGMSAYLIQALVTSGHAVKSVAVLGVDDHFGRSAYKADQLYKQSGLDDKSIVARILEL